MDSSYTRIFNGINDDTIFTTFVTIGIFIIGYIVNKIIENRKESKRLKEVKEYFIALCEFIERPIRIQMEVLKEYASNIASEENINFTYKDTSDFDLKNFTNISHQDLYKVLYRKKKTNYKEKTQRFNEIINSINYFIKQKENTYKNFQTFFEDFKKFENIWITNGDAILRNFDSFVSYNKANDIKPSEDLFLKKIDSVIFNWSKMENSKNIFVTYKNLIDPLRNICKEYSGDGRAVILLSFIVGSTFAFNNITGIKKLYSEFFENEEKEIKEKYDRLINAVNYFKNST